MDKDYIENILKNDAADIIFTTLDHRKRKMLCTRNWDWVKGNDPDFEVKGSGSKRVFSNPAMIIVWDLENHGFRTLNTETIKSIVSFKIDEVVNENILTKEAQKEFVDALNNHMVVYIDDEGNTQRVTRNADLIGKYSLYNLDAYAERRDSLKKFLKAHPYIAMDLVTTMCIDTNPARRTAYTIVEESQIEECISDLRQNEKSSA